MNLIICGYLTNVYNYTIPTLKRHLVHMAMCKLLVISIQGFYGICNIDFFCCYRSCNGSKRSNYKGTQCFCSHQWTILIIPFDTSPSDWKYRKVDTATSESSILARFCTPISDIVAIVLLLVNKISHIQTRLSSCLGIGTEMLELELFQIIALGKIKVN